MVCRRCVPPPALGCTWRRLPHICRRPASLWVFGRSFQREGCFVRSLTLLACGRSFRREEGLVRRLTLGVGVSTEAFLSALWAFAKRSIVDDILGNRVLHCPCGVWGCFQRHAATCGSVQSWGVSRHCCYSTQGSEGLRQSGAEIARATHPPTGGDFLRTS